MITTASSISWTRDAWETWTSPRAEAGLDDVSTLLTTTAHQSAPEHTGRGGSTTQSSAPRDFQEPDLVRAAFREVHGPGLYGFALLLTLGDRSRADPIASATLAEGVARVAQLRHPERAAAWLRGRVVRAARRTPSGGLQSRAERRAVLSQLGLSEPALATLESLSLDDRAAIVASVLERFSPADVAVILDRDLDGTRRVLRSARRRYLAGATHWLAGLSSDALPAGAITARVEEIAARALGARMLGTTR
jgi:DNA-directed RNA polymerase specialized sigma24 family protein